MTNYLTELFGPAFKDTTNVLTMGGMGVGMLVLSMLGNASKKGRLATARFGSSKEKANARKIGRAQLDGQKHNEVCLYIGRPRDKKDGRTLYYPDCQQGVFVTGAPGTGKTFGTIDPLVRAAIDQGKPIVVYDFKYGDPRSCQTGGLVYYALKRGYDVRIFAPGYQESEVCNPLTFLKNSQDSESAAQLAAVLNKNFKLATGGNNASEDPFFKSSGDQLLEAVMMLTKSIPETLTVERFREFLQLKVSELLVQVKLGTLLEVGKEDIAWLKQLSEKPDAELQDYLDGMADIMMCQALLALPELPSRIQGARLKVWIRTAWDQLISVRESEKTVASIIATASIMFAKFTKQNTLGAFCGKTSLPTNVTGKTLVIFGMDQSRRDVVGPLLASVLHMTITQSLGSGRAESLVLAMDEATTLFLPQYINWVNEFRSYGFVGLFSTQTNQQIFNTYGKEKGLSLIAAHGTKYTYNPQEFETAKYWSDYFGDEEVHYRSKSTSSGSKSGPSTSYADQDRTRKLVAPEQLLTLPKRTGIVVSPAYADKQASGLPIRQLFKLPKADIEEAKTSSRYWPKIRDRLGERSSQTTPRDIEFELRRWLVDVLFPVPEKRGGASGKALI